MIKTILIANRGEIACRIIRTAKAQGIKTVAIYSTVDAHAQHVKLADFAFHIGPAQPTQSYLNQAKIINIAVAENVDAIHPGYGFLSENADFAETCAKHNIVFIGPTAAAIQAMGSKSAAKHIMAAAGVPLVKGYHGTNQSPEFLLAQARAIGFPVLLKAVAGGGGKGMRIIHAPDEFVSGLTAAKREALQSFGNDEMLVEKYVAQPRHIEVQVFCDTQGNAVYLHDRDCSIQRRYQKIVEEAPAPGLSDATRKAMGEAALAAAQAISYVGAGTVEFLLDKDENFYFMEMNTRLQVEHPVTEMITQQDLVAWQIKVANGEPLPLQQHEILRQGHAIEVRIYAEAPDNEFLPSSGTLRFYQEPPTSSHLRVDSGVTQGDEISVFYDPMISKLITFGEHRNAALTRLEHALGQYYIAGLDTNIGYLQKVLKQPEFITGQVSTHFIDEHKDRLSAPNETTDDAIANRNLALACVILQTRLEQSYRSSGIDISTNWRNLSSPTLYFDVQSHSTVSASSTANVTKRVELTPVISPNDYSAWMWQDNSAEKIETNDCSSNYWHGKFGEITLSVPYHLTQGTNGINHTPSQQLEQTAVVPNCLTNLTLWLDGKQYNFIFPAPDMGQNHTDSSTDNFVAPMNGTVVSLGVDAPATVKEGDVLMIIEAMKMEHNLTAPCDGMLSEYFFAAGDLVSGGATVLTFTPSTEAD